MLKRLLLCLLTTLLLCVPALAEEVVELPDLVVTYTPPEGLYLLTRESSATAFNAIGLSQRSLLPWMEQNDCYAVMYDLGTGAELLLFLAPSEDALPEAMTPQELEQLCTYWVEGYELNGCEDVSVTVFESAAGRYIQSAYRTYEADGTPCYVVGLVALRSGCHVQMSLFTYGEAPSDELISRLLAMADSVRLELPAGVTELSACGVTICMSLPDGLVLLPAGEMPDALAPETPAGEVIGAAAAEDGSWWTM